MDVKNFYDVLNDSGLIKNTMAYFLGYFGTKKILIINHKIDYETMKNYQLNISKKLEGS